MDEYGTMGKDLVFGNVSAVVEQAYLLDFQREWGRWHRSKERKAGEHPFGQFMLNKKWRLEEEFNKHILRFQQVRSISTNIDIQMTELKY